MTNRITPSGFFIIAHAVEAYKNDLMHGLNFPTPNPYEGKDRKKYGVAAFVWKTAYNDEKFRTELERDRQNVIKLKDYLQDAGVVNP